MQGGGDSYIHAGFYLAKICSFGLSFNVIACSSNLDRNTDKRYETIIYILGVALRVVFS